MFRIVALVEGKQPICDFRQAFEIVQKENQRCCIGYL